MFPIRYDGNCAVFTVEQVNLFGEPWEYGFEEYIVISSLDYERPPATDFKFERDRGKLRPIHRYNRVKRFEWVLYQILGYRGDVPPEIVDLVRKKYDKRRGYIWASIQKILQRNKLRVYYNRIGQIIWRLTGWKINFGDSYLFLQDLVRDFQCMQFKKMGKRKYFPNLRFVALKMLIRHGADFDYHVPLLKTKSKLKGLETVFENMIVKWEEEEVLKLDVEKHMKSLLCFHQTDFGSSMRGLISFKNINMNLNM
ncbi:MAG: hypothetical protein V4708_17480 [Bacteroidota bacterium]